jgi:hypothetical protein
MADQHWEPIVSPFAVAVGSATPRGKHMKTISKLAIATAFTALAACGSNNNANNAEYNATDVNAETTDLNVTAPVDMNATSNMDMNATGNVDINGTGNATTNNTM